jgi:Flp pilus assembly protein TadD
LRALERAAEIDTASARFAFVYAVALNSGARTDDALKTLEASHARHPADRETLFALVTMNRDAGRADAALAWAQQLATIDPSAQPLVDRLRRTGPSR